MKHVLRTSAKLHRFLEITWTVIFLSCIPTGVHPEEITFQADTMTGKSGSKSDETKLTGNAHVKTNTMEIKADTIILSGEDFRYITADGMVEGKNTESQLDFTCGKMFYDRKTKIAKLENSVRMIDVQNDVTADAQIIEYNQNTEIATMQIGVTLKQKDNVCTAAFALYRKNAQMLEMSGNPKIVQGADTFRAQEISLNLQTQEIELSGRVSGTVTDSRKEENSNPENLKAETPTATKNASDADSADSEEKPELPSITDILNSDKPPVSEQEEAPTDEIKKQE